MSSTYSTEALRSREGLEDTSGSRTASDIGVCLPGNFHTTQKCLGSAGHVEVPEKWYPERHHSVVPRLHTLPHLTLYILPAGWVSASSRISQKFTSLTSASLAGIRTEPSKRLTGTPTDSLSSRGRGDSVGFGTGT